MELFSLEDEYGDELFITQNPRDSNVEDKEFSQSDGNEGFLGVNPRNFQSPCSSLVNRVQGVRPVYEDISDDETAFENKDAESNFE